MVSFLLPPTFMPCTPSSQPRITWPRPRPNWNASLRSWLESNLVPLVSQPV
jgi:hypothetical protein